MLVRLIYASRAVEAVDVHELAGLFKRARARNLQAGITGLLCHCAGSKTFMQVLEGGRAQVNALYHDITRDARHADVQLLAYEEIGERRFAGWALGQVSMDRLNPALVLKYSESALLDPFAMTGAGAMALFEDLVATASVMGER